ncbi:DegT/DnrJ/EryC1/StrS family aminotransferase [bacterium]|nr:DegT/DnrJ/EryC1/StrS family aminotransferase [bacterium]
MKENNLSRRKFLATASAGAIAAIAAGVVPACGNVNKRAGNLAVLGGQPVRTKGWSWPPTTKAMEESLVSAFNSGKWCRFDGGAKMTSTFEKKYAEMMGMKRCIATGSGTQALHCAMYGIGVEAGDEVLVPPYTFISSVVVITLMNALPVFVDTDPETFQMDPAKIEEKINGNTKAIEPVHICGIAADMNRINAIAKKHNLKVVEDACQGPMGLYDGKLLGTMSDIGCFSFQSSKPIACGEGGAAIGNNDEIMDRTFSFHTLGVEPSSRDLSGRRRLLISAPKYRMNEFEASVLLPQVDELEQRVETRTANANYLTEKLKDLPGIVPQKRYKEQTRASYYLYDFLYKKEHFNNVSRDKFQQALAAEGVPSWVQNPYELNKEPYIEDTLNSAAFKKIYSKARLKRYREENDCPVNRQRAKESVGIWHWALAGSKKDVDDIADVFYKIYENRDKLAKS